MASSIPSTAMIGAIVSTTHKRQNASKKQLIFKQVARNLENAIGYTAGPLGVASQARNGPTGRAC